MIIFHDPDEWVSVSETHVCAYHRRHPGKSYAGCCCWGGISQRRATPEEYAANRRKRLEARRKEIRQELDAINEELSDR